MSDRALTHVAVYYNEKVYSLPAPNRHHDVIRTIPGGVAGPDIQGFLDDQGAFYNRRDAYLLASFNGQLKRGPGGYQGDRLYSEDLW